MGHQRKRTIYKLVFQDEYEGMEVRARSMPLGKFMKMAKLLDLDTTALTSTDVESMSELFALFVEVLIDWNLEDTVEDDEGNEVVTPVPATLDGIMSLEIDEAMMIIVKYSDALGGIAAPLAQPSTDGSPSLEDGIPMEVNT